MAWQIQHPDQIRRRIANEESGGNTSVLKHNFWAGSIHSFLSGKPNSSCLQQHSTKNKIPTGHLTSETYARAWGDSVSRTGQCAPRKPISTYSHSHIYRRNCLTHWESATQFPFLVQVYKYKQVYISRIEHPTVLHITTRCTESKAIALLEGQLTLSSSLAKRPVMRSSAKCQPTSACLICLIVFGLMQWAAAADAEPCATNYWDGVSPEYEETFNMAADICQKKNVRDNGNCCYVQNFGQIDQKTFQPLEPIWSSKRPDDAGILTGHPKNRCMVIIDANECAVATHSAPGYFDDSCKIVESTCCPKTKEISSIWNGRVANGRCCTLSQTIKSNPGKNKNCFPNRQTGKKDESGGNSTNGEQGSAKSASGCISAHTVCNGETFQNMFDRGHLTARSLHGWKVSRVLKHTDSSGNVIALTPDHMVKFKGQLIPFSSFCEMTECLGVFERVTNYYHPDPLHSIACGNLELTQLTNNRQTSFMLRLSHHGARRVLWRILRPWNL
jgi:hypothetical protein